MRRTREEALALINRSITKYGMHPEYMLTWNPIIESWRYTKVNFQADTWFGQFWSHCNIAERNQYNDRSLVAYYLLASPKSL